MTTGVEAVARPWEEMAAAVAAASLVAVRTTSLAGWRILRRQEWDSCCPRRARWRGRRAHKVVREVCLPRKLELKRLLAHTGAAAEGAGRWSRRLRELSGAVEELSRQSPRPRRW
jgi:hypothetical protein